jgi:hypothetical protein
MSHEHEEGLTGGQRELEQALAHLRPARGGLSRDRMLFRAGLAHGRRRGRQWNVALAATVLVAAGAAVLAASRAPQTQIVERVVYRDAPREDLSPRPAVPPLAVARPWTLGNASGASGAEYFRLREMVLEKGLDALPAGNAHAASETLSDLWPAAGRPVERTRPFRGAGGLQRWILNGDRS